MVDSLARSPTHEIKSKDGASFLPAASCLVLPQACHHSRSHSIRWQLQLACAVATAARVAGAAASAAIVAAAAAAIELSKVARQARQAQQRLCDQVYTTADMNILSTIACFKDQTRLCCTWLHNRSVYNALVHMCKVPLLRHSAGYMSAFLSKPLHPQMTVCLISRTRRVTTTCAACNPTAHLQDGVEIASVAVVEHPSRHRLWVTRPRRWQLPEELPYVWLARACRLLLLPRLHTPPDQCPWFACCSGRGLCRGAERQQRLAGWGVLIPAIACQHILGVKQPCHTPLVLLLPMLKSVLQVLPGSICAGLDTLELGV